MHWKITDTHDCMELFAFYFSGHHLALMPDCANKPGTIQIWAKLEVQQERCENGLLSNTVTSRKSAAFLIFPVKSLLYSQPNLFCKSPSDNLVWKYYEPPSFRLVSASKKLLFFFLRKEQLLLSQTCSIWVSDNFRFISLSFFSSPMIY